MKKLGLFFTTGLLLLSCDTTGVKPSTTEIEKTSHSDVSDSVKVQPMDVDHEVVNKKELSNGLKIEWFEHGDGEAVKYGDMLDLDFKVTLEDGTEVQNSANIPAQKYHHFMVGFGLQFEAWDLTLEQLKVGDFVEVFMPSDLLYGKQKVGNIPPNSNFITRIKVRSKISPDREVDGNKVWIFARDYDETIEFGEDKVVEYNVIGYTESNKIYLNTFASRKPFSLNLEDQGVIPGLKKALINAKKDDRLFIYVPAAEAYKAKGYVDLVKPNEDLFFNVTILDIK